MTRRWLMTTLGIVAASVMLLGNTDSAWARRGCGCGYTRAYNNCGGCASGWGRGWGWRNRGVCNTGCNTGFYAATYSTGCATGGCSAGGCSTGGCSASVTYGSNGPVYTYTSNATQTYSSQPATAPQPYTTGYQPQATYDANGNLINNNQSTNVEVNNNNRIDQNPNLNPQSNSNASGKIDAQPNSNDGINQTTTSGNANINTNVPATDAPAPQAPAPEIK